MYQLLVEYSLAEYFNNSKAAREVWEVKHPDKVPGWDPNLDMFGIDKETKKN